MRLRSQSSPKKFRMPSRTRGENAVALIVLHMKDELQRFPTDDELKQFMYKHGLHTDVVLYELETVIEKLEKLKKGETDAPDQTVHGDGVST